MPPRAETAAYRTPGCLSRVAAITLGTNCGSISRLATPPNVKTSPPRTKPVVEGELREYCCDARATHVAQHVDRWIGSHAPWVCFNDRNNTSPVAARLKKSESRGCRPNEIRLPREEAIKQTDNGACILHSEVSHGEAGHASLRLGSLAIEGDDRKLSGCRRAKLLHDEPGIAEGSVLFTPQHQQPPKKRGSPRLGPCAHSVVNPACRRRLLHLHQVPQRVRHRLLPIPRRVQACAVATSGPRNPAVQHRTRYIVRPRRPSSQGSRTSPPVRSSVVRKRVD